VTGRRAGRFTGLAERAGTRGLICIHRIDFLAPARDHEAPALLAMLEPPCFRRLVRRRQHLYRRYYPNAREIAGSALSHRSGRLLWVALRVLRLSCEKRENTQIHASSGVMLENPG
jgi:hypothetical protein